MSRPDEHPDPYRPPEDQRGDAGVPPRPSGSQHPFGSPNPTGSADKQRPARPGRNIVLLAIAGLVLALLWPVGFTLSAAAVAWAIWLRRQARRRGESAPGTTTALVLGITGMAIPVALVVVLFPELRDFGQCMQGAHTKIAQTDCQDEFEKVLLRKVGAR